MRKISWLAAIAIAVAAGQPVAAQECVSGPFMIFFDSNSDRVTPQGSNILDNAADAYKICTDAQVVISGHTDRKGSDDDNVVLSQRMAVNVRNYLAARGVPVSIITVQAFGETRPLIETADGIREPQNRRVEITFGPGSGW